MLNRNLNSLKTGDKSSFSASFAHKIDAVLLHRFLGVPVFLASMYGVFIFTIHVGGVFQDFFDMVSRTFLIEGVKHWLTVWQAPALLTGFAVDGVCQGIQTTLSFIPIIASLFLCLSFLEASGYMARSALVMEKFMQRIGLPGRSFIPLILGFGCNVPAVMATRMLQNERERILTILMIPFMSCGARLTIYALFISAFFPKSGQNILFGLYLIGIAVALIVGYTVKGPVLPGPTACASRATDLPPYRWPNLAMLCRSTARHVKEFVLKAGILIIPLCAVIGTLGAIQDKTSMDNWLGLIGKRITPIFAPMGITEDNWPATVSLLTGVVAKEVVVGTLNALYVQDGQATLQTEDKPRILGVMVDRFHSTAAAFAYLLFVLLYFPCISVVAVIRNELNRSWAFLAATWTTGLAYAVAVLFYQCATFLENPLQATAWILAMSGSLIGGLWGMRRHVQRCTLPKSNQKAFPTGIVIQG